MHIQAWHVCVCCGRACHACHAWRSRAWRFRHSRTPCCPVLAHCGLLTHLLSLSYFMLALTPSVASSCLKGCATALPKLFRSLYTDAPSMPELSLQPAGWSACEVQLHCCADRCSLAMAAAGAAAATRVRQPRLPSAPPPPPPLDPLLQQLPGATHFPSPLELCLPPSSWPYAALRSPSENTKRNSSSRTGMKISRPWTCRGPPTAARRLAVGRGSAVSCGPWRGEAVRAGGRRWGAAAAAAPAPAVGVPPPPA